MRMDFNFYSKSQLSITIDYSGPDSYPESPRHDLFLFSCFALRNLRNLGEHLVAKVLAGALLDSEQIRNILNNGKFTSCSSLLSSAKYYALSSSAKDINAYAQVAGGLYDEYTYPDHILRAVDDMILAKKPNIVNRKGKGRRGFVVTFSPFNMKMYGFGVLGKDVNHHAFHAVCSLAGKFGEKYKDNKDFQEDLIKIAKLCGEAYVQKGIPIDVVTFSNKLLNDINIE